MAAARMKGKDEPITATLPRATLTAVRRRLMQRGFLGLAEEQIATGLAKILQREGDDLEVTTSPDKWRIIRGIVKEIDGERKVLREDAARVREQLRENPNVEEWASVYKAAEVDPQMTLFGEGQ